MMEILRQYFNDNEISEVEKRIEKDKDFKEKVEKIKAGQIDSQLDKLQAKVDKIKDNFETRFEAFKKAIFELETKQTQTEQKVKKQVKEQAEEKGFSFDKVWEETKKAFKEKGFFAAVGVFFSTFFSNFFSDFFNKTEKKVDDLKTEVVSNLTHKTPGTFENNEYKSYKKKLDIKFDKEGNIKKILINGEKYVIPKGYKLENKKGELCLVGGGTLSNNIFSLDYLGYFFDKSDKNKDKYKIDENTDRTNIIDNFKPEFFNGNIIFQKENLVEKVKDNIIEGKNIKLYCKNKIDENKESQKIIIDKLEINGNIYELYYKGNKNLEFDLVHKNEGYYIDFGVSTGELKIDDISSLVNKKGYKVDSDTFSIYKLVDSNGKILDNLNFIIEALKTGDWKKYKFGDPILAIKKLK